MIPSPRVTVLLPVRNGLPYLADALASLRAQTFDDFEIIVIDDGSTDGTARALRRARDPRLRVISTRGEGIAAALNRGLEMARGAYVARQDVDDRSAPARLARQVEFLDRRREIDVLATCASYIDAAGRPVDDAWTRLVREQQDPAQEPDAIRALMPLTCCITHGTVMMRADVLRRAGGYRTDAVPAEDYDLWLRLLPAGRFAKLPDRLYDYRVHADQSGAERRAAQIAQSVRAKLAFVRRAHAWLPAPAGLLVADDTRGTPYYHQLAREFGLVERPRPAAYVAGGGAWPVRVAAADWDLLAVTAFADVPSYAAALAPRLHGGRVVQEGNLFLRHPEDLP